MVGKGQIKHSGLKKKTPVQIIDVESVEVRNRRGARVYHNLEIPKDSPSTSQKRTDGPKSLSKSPSKRMRSLSPMMDKDLSDGLVPPQKRLRRKTKV